MVREDKSMARKDKSMVRKDMMDTDSDSSDSSNKSSDEEHTTTTKRRKSSKSSSNESDSENEQRVSKKQKRVTHSSSESDNSDAENDEKNRQNVKASLATTSSQQQQQQQHPVDEKSDKSDLEDGQLTSDSESESDSNSEFDDGYGDDLMGNEEDRNYLEKLSEKERETELFKRAERRDQLKRRWEIERKLKQSRKDANQKNKEKKPKIKKPKAPAPKKVIEKPQKVSPPREDPISATSHLLLDIAAQPTTAEESSPNDYSKEDYFDPKERSKERKKNVEMNKTDDKRSSAMAMLKARREGKQKRDIEREAQKKEEDEKEDIDDVSEKSTVKLNPRDIYSDDSDSDSEEKKSPSRRSSSSRSSTSSSEDESQEQVYKKPVHISTLEEMNKLRISRFKLEKFINLPIFEKTVIGCFVRINIGNNIASQKLVYRVAEIIGVVETSKVYLFGSSRTNKGIMLKHGTQERVFRLEFVSNQDFTQNEFDKWRDLCALNDINMPTVDMIEQKKKDVQAALNYEFKEEDIDKIIEEKNRFRAHPTNYAMKKTQLMKDRDAAMNQGNEEQANEINTQIQELEERANALDKKRTSTISLISYINDRNRRKNVEEAEKAIMEEARQNRGMKLSDPFTRRSTKPTMAFKPKSAQEEIVMMPEPPKPNKSKDKKVEGHTSGENLYSLHDFDIELDVALPLPISNNTPVIPKPVDKAQEDTPKLRRILNLEDYKKKRGLI